MNAKELDAKIEEKVGKYPIGYGNPKNLSTKSQQVTTENPYGLSELEIYTLKNKTEYWKAYFKEKSKITGREYSA